MGLVLGWAEQVEEVSGSIGVDLCSDAKDTCRNNGSVLCEESIDSDS